MDLFVHTHCFLKNTVPHLVDIYAKNVDERGGKFVCESSRLPNILVCNRKFSLEHIDVFAYFRALAFLIALKQNL